MQNNDKAGLLTGKVFGLDGKYTGTHKLFPSLSRSLLGNKFGRWISKNKFISPKEKVIEPTKVEVVTGAFMFFRRSLFEKINGFDTQFFLDCEEEDISKKYGIMVRRYICYLSLKLFMNMGAAKRRIHSDYVMNFFISYKKLMFKHYSKPYSIIMLLLISLKIFKYFFREDVNMILSNLRLKGFPEECSLRYKQ